MSSAVRNKYIPVSEKETASLIRLSSEHGVVHFAFGSGGVALHAGEHPWAEALLRQWRGQDYDAGGGI